MRFSTAVCLAVSNSAAVVTLVACGVPAAPNGLLGPIRQAPPSATRGTAGSYLYAAQCCGVLNSGDVTVYGPGLTGITRRIRGKQFYPIVIALDGAGTLYVLNQSAGYAGGVSVTEYDSGGGRPSREITGLYWGVTLALDGSNDLYVANCNTCIDSGDGARTTEADSITVYGPSSTTPLRTITQGVHVPSALALDAQGNLYVANGGSGKRAHPPSITVYAPGSTSLLRTVTKGITRPGHLATDNAGNIFVADGSSKVIEFAPQLSNVLRTITSGIASPEALAVDDSGALYVANDDSYPSRGWVSVYARGSSSEEYRITRNITQPVALATDAGGDLYVANDNWGLPGHPGWTSEYPPGARKAVQSVKSRRYGVAVSLGLGSH